MPSRGAKHCPKETIETRLDGLAGNVAGAEGKNGWAGQEGRLRVHKDKVSH
jgi:hypothetical protein